jgi:hypothetical protein
MDRKTELRMARGACHVCAPKDWKTVPDLTGDYDFDATIMHSKNRDLPARLALYVKGPKNAYGPRTGYNSMHAYSGDD